jgi:hypothetical protein
MKSSTQFLVFPTKVHECPGMTDSLGLVDCPILQLRIDMQFARRVSTLT